MKAIILAAGSGSRLAPVSGGVPKCLLPLHGRSLLARQLDLLEAVGLTDVVVVTGFRAEAVLAEEPGRATFRHYPDYANTNNLATLRAHRDLLAGDVLIAFADVLTTSGDLDRLAEHPGDIILLIDPSVRRSGTMRVRHQGHTLLDVGPHIAVNSGTGSFIGLTKCSSRGAAALAEQLGMMSREHDARRYYTEAVRKLIAAGHRVHVVAATPGQWVEVDTPEDYEVAQRADFFLTAQHPEATTRESGGG